MKTTNTLPPAAGQAAHTPTPYRFMDVGNPKGMLRIEVANGTQICAGHVSHQVVAWTDNQPTKREDAAFIVRACNGFDQLVTLARNVANEQKSPHREQALAILSRIENERLHQV